MEERFVEVGPEGDTMRLAVLESGTGGSPLLLVHGFTGAKEDFVDEVDRLAARGFHVVAPDHRGHGRSAQPDDEAAYSLETFATDMFCLADALGWPSFDLLGHSMGGMVAQLMVIAQPERVRRLILMDTHHGAIGGVDAEVIAAGAALARTDGLAVIQELLKFAANPLENPAHVRTCAEREGYEAWCDSKMLVCSPAMYAAVLGQFDTVADRLDDLAAVRTETLVLVGELDKPFVGASRRMAATMPAATLVVIPDAGHSPQFESTVAWREAVDGFLADTAGRAGVITTGRAT
ncbi:MAG TPA: alpha/beta hydrolase [Microthrixaceae bacterium]|nr:alpha/beta hydrolase [Microthrixaceae bacterium]